MLTAMIVTAMAVMMGFVVLVNFWLADQLKKAQRELRHERLYPPQQPLGPGAHQFGFGGPTLLPSGQWMGSTASARLNIGGTGYGIQLHSNIATEDLTAPDEEENVILTGWKRFDVSNGFLVSPVSGYVWHSPRLTASCPQLYNLGIGPEACRNAVPEHLQDPSAAHNCGIFAMKGWSEFFTPELAGRYPDAIAKVRLFGVVQEGVDGYAAEHCLIEEVYLPTGGKPIGGDEIEQLLYRYNVPVKEESPWT